MEGVAATHDIENQYALEKSMREQLNMLSPMTDYRIIHRVPSRLRDVRAKAYTPQVVSIGPFHHGKPALKAMEEHKMRYLQYFLGRSNKSLRHYIEEIQNREAEVRSCYSEIIEFKSKEFVKMILVDAIFLIEFLFRNYCYPRLLDENDCLFGQPDMSSNVWLDLFMLENQLPFFILEYLFDPEIFPIPPDCTSRLEGVERLSMMYLYHYFLDDHGLYIGGESNLETSPDCRGIYTGEEVARLETVCPSPVKVEHFVLLLRKLYVAPALNAEARAGLWAQTAPSIEELDQAGVKFKVGSNTDLFDIQFRNGVLEIPRLQIVGSSEVILRNLIAYEQCLLGEERYLSDYVCMMDQLVDTPKDVGLLVDYGIVKNRLGGGDIELSTMINSMTTQVAISPTRFRYGTLCEDLNTYYSEPRHRTIAILRRNYFNTPWATISFSAALLLLLLTIIQTICSIISLRNF